MPVSTKRCVQGCGSRRSSDSSRCNRVGGGLFARLDGRVRSVRFVSYSKLTGIMGNSSTAGCVLYEAEAKGGSQAERTNSDWKNMRDCIQNVPQRGKPKQRTRISTLRFNTSISEKEVAVAMLRVSTELRRMERETEMALIDR